LLLRARALDNQCYAIGVSVAQYKEDPKIYQAWAHSTLVDPFGKVLIGLDENPNIAYYEVDPNYTLEVREQIPISKQKRNDIYKLEEVI
jgi:omega-amidase